MVYAVHNGGVHIFAAWGRNDDFFRTAFQMLAGRGFAADFLLYLRYRFCV